MKIRNQKDFWAGLMFLAFGLGFAIVARNYQMGTAVRMGPAYFPTVLGGLMAVLGAIILARSFVSRVTGEAAKVRMSFNFPDLVVGLAVFALFAWASKAMFGNADWGMLVAAIVLAALSIAMRPASKPLVLIIAGCLAFAYLLKPLGLILATLLLVFIAAFGGHEYRTKEVAILAVGLVIFSVVVFVKGLTLPFPICPAIIDNCPIR
jgi:uncharacterized membrane protein (UPF0136 family)